MPRKSQKGDGWNQTIKTQTGASLLRESKTKVKKHSIIYTGKEKVINKRKHKEAIHLILGHGFIPEDLKLPENPIKTRKVNKVDHQYYIVPDKQIGGFLPFLAALIPGAVALAKAASIGGATALGGLAVNKIVN